MLFLTAQPYKVFEYFNTGGIEYFPDEFNEKYTNGKGVSNEPIERQVNYKPIFVSSINNRIDRLVTQTVACPSKAECMVIINTEQYDKISFCNWLQYLADKNVDADIAYHDGMEPEYIIPSIKKEEVLCTIPFVKKKRTLEESITFYKGYILTDHFSEKVYSDDKSQYIESYMNYWGKKYISLQKKFYKTFKPGLYNDDAFNQLRKDIKNFLC